MRGDPLNDHLRDYLARSGAQASGEPIPPHIVDAIREALPPSVVIGKYVHLKKAGRELRGLSPFAKERTPSFFVNDEKRRWFDFSSGKNGNIFDFLMETEGLPFPEAVERLAAQAGMPLPVVTREDDARAQHRRRRRPRARGPAACR